MLFRSPQVLADESGVTQVEIVVAPHPDQPAGAVELEQLLPHRAVGSDDVLEVVLPEFVAVAGLDVGEAVLPVGLGMEPSLVPGLPPLLIAEAGREGGPIGLCGAKKLDLRRSVPGVGGRRDKLSTVRSDKDNRDILFALGVEGPLSSSRS